VKRPEFKLKGGIRRPNSKLRGGGGVERPTLQTPKFLDDLVRDLRERRLLPVVIVLLVAIVAVPIALSVSASSPPAADPAATGIVPADAPEAQAAVLAENPGLRDYRERLEAFKAKNPFKQQFEPTVAAGGAGGAASGESAVPGVPSTDTSTTTAPTGGGGGSAPPAGSTDTAPSGSTETTTPPSDGGGSGGGGLQFFAPRVDVLFGAEGNVKRHKIKLLDVLNPVGAFAGVSEDAQQALFVLSTDVVGVPGDGQCAPNPDNCEFLALKKGDAVEILYQPAGAPAPTVYKLTVERIRMVPIEDDPTSSNTKGASGTILPG
jgi:hypothetical protein